jgi:ankyrin repeat protein
MHDNAAQQRAAEDRALRHTMLKKRLVEACQNGATFDAMKLLRGGIPLNELNAVDDIGRTCLMYAAERRHTQIASLLMVYKAEVDTANAEGWTPLMCVVSSVCGLPENDADDVASSLLALLRAGANPNAVPHSGGTALMTACASGSVPMVQYLLDYAAHVDVADTMGMTPLILAADGGHAAVVSLLLNAAAPVDVPDPFGKTALMSACGNSHKHIVAALLEANADPLARTMDGCSALLFAIESLVDADFADSTKRSKEASGGSLVTMLLVARANPAAAADDGRSPLQLAEIAGDCNLMAILLGKGMDCMS